MASSKQELKKPGTGGSLLAPSKFGADFGRSEKKSLFTGLKASKLTSITQSVCSSSASTIPAQPQHNSATQAALEPPASKPFCDPVGPSSLSSSCTPVISKVTLNTSRHSINPEKKQTAEIQKETPNAEQKVSQGDKKESSFLFGQNLADRAADFVETANGEKTSEVDSVDVKAAQASSSFIFGQHLAERVTTTDKDPLQKDQVTKELEESKKPPDAGAEESKSHDDNKRSEDISTEVKSISSNSKTDDIKVAISPEKNSSNTAILKTHEPTASLSGKTLNENAAEYFESHLAPPKRKFDEVEVITGEENEHNVLHMSAKLYIFDKNKSWLEKGRGELRLNDLSVAAANATSNTVGLTSSQASRDVKRKVMSSRIVMRTIGSLRVILNTKVYHGMSVEKPNEKSIRLTGMDDGVVKVFLIIGSPKDADALHCALKSRLAELKSTQDEATESESQENESGEKRTDICDPEGADTDGVSSSKKPKTEL